MGEFVGTILELANVDAHIVCRMALISNVESKRLDLLDFLSNLIVVIPKEYAVVNIYHEDMSPFQTCSPKCDGNTH